MPSVPETDASAAYATAQPCGPSPAYCDRDRDGQEATHLRPEENGQRAERARPQGSDEVGDSPGEARAEREQERAHPTGRVAAIASSAFAWYRTDASAVWAERTSW